MTFSIRKHNLRIQTAIKIKFSNCLLSFVFNRSNQKFTFNSSKSRSKFLLCAKYKKLDEYRYKMSKTCLWSFMIGRLCHLEKIIICCIGLSWSNKTEHWRLKLLLILLLLFASSEILFLRVLILFKNLN